MPSLRAGGQERVMSHLANYFADTKNEEVHLLLFYKNVRSYTISTKVIIHEPDFFFNGKFRIFYTLRTIFYIRKKINNIKPDVILSFGEIWNSLVLLSTLFMDIQKYISDRCRPSLRLSFFQRLLRSLLYPSVDGIIAQTQVAKETLCQRIKCPQIKVIGNPIRKIEGNSICRQNYILNVGRFSKEKRQKLIIQLFSELGRKDWTLIFVGDGPRLEECKNYVSSIGFTQNILFFGEVNNVEEFYLSSKIFAYASISEGFPNVLGEALSAGLASVTFNFEAGAEDLILNGYNGYIIDNDDYELYKVKLLTLMDNIKIRETFRENSKVVLKKFNLENICEEFYKFITSS